MTVGKITCPRCFHCGLEWQSDDPESLVRQIMDLNTLVRKMENRHIADLDALAEMGMELRRTRDTLLTIRHLAKALDYAGIKKLVDEH